MKTRTPTASAADTALELDLSLMVDQLRARGALCHVAPSVDNQGLNLHVSFRVADARSPSGALSVALRAAALTVTPAQPDQAWAWNDAFLATAAAERALGDRTLSTVDTAALTGSEHTEIKSEVEGKLKAVLVEVLTRVTVGGWSERAYRRETTRGAAAKAATVVSPIQVHDEGRSYTIEFDAGPHADLVALNTRLSRSTVLDAAEPSSIELEAVTIDFKIQDPSAMNPGDHAVHIRQATGALSALRFNPAKRLMAELLLSKLIQTRTEADRLWPDAETEE